MCFTEAKWKSEFVVQHKFDYIDIDEFRRHSLWTRIKYSTVYLLGLMYFLIFITDIVSVLLLFDVRMGFKLSNEQFSVIPDTNYFGKAQAKWVYLGCMLVSLILFVVDVRKSRRIIRSKDISLAYTHTLTSRYYSFQDYAYFCFFDRVNQMRQTKDRLALFVFFRMKEWKWILFAEAPRKAIMLVAVYLIMADSQRRTELFNNSIRRDNIPATAAVFLIFFSLGVFVVTVLSVWLALVLYVPLICDIRGNLKEYICHKIDKRISKLIAGHSQRKQILSQMTDRHSNRTTGLSSWSSRTTSPTSPTVPQKDYGMRASSRSASPPVNNGHVSNSMHQHQQPRSPLHYSIQSQPQRPTPTSFVRESREMNLNPTSRLSEPPRTPMRRAHPNPISKLNNSQHK